MYGYTFGQWIKIYRHLTMGGYPKRHLHSNLSKLLTNVINTTVIKITTMRVSIHYTAVLSNCRSQFMLDRLGRCLKLFVSTESTS